MMTESLRTLLEEVRAGRTDVAAALVKLRHLPFEDLGFAKVDHHRALRQGNPEVIFGEGKTAEQISSIAGELYGPQRSGYGATKAGMNAFFYALRTELWNEGIPVTVVIPGAKQIFQLRENVRVALTPDRKPDTKITFVGISRE